MNMKLYAAAVLALIVIVFFSFGFYVVDEREQIVVTRLDKPVRVIVGDYREDFEQLKQEIIDSATRSVDNSNLDIRGLRVDQGPGLRFKMPFIDKAERFPDTVLEYDADPREVVTRDKKKINVDYFARWRIDNPLLYRTSLLGSEVKARAGLDVIISSLIREELASNNLIEIIRTTKVFEREQQADQIAANVMSETLERGREEIIQTVTRRVSVQALAQYGIRVLDVRIKRAELVDENLQAVFDRMKAERNRISLAYRSEGHKDADIIRGETDKSVVMILAEARAEAQRIRGEGEAQALNIFAKAFGKNAQLYRYLRSLEVMKEATPSGSELVIGLESSIYRYMKPE